MEVAIVQCEPVIGQVQHNMDHVDAMVESLHKDDNIDILVLSEMIFTGYVFKTKSEVEPLAELAGSGPTFEWCQRHARRLQCLVTCGYVERDPDDPSTLYNAMMVVSPDGQLVCNPRKTFLYETDKSWATPGDGFTSWYCDWLDKTISFGICMDINPFDFVAEFSAFEFANHVLEHGSDLILFSCAWNDFEPESNETLPTLNYWATRLSPVIDQLQSGNYPKPNCHFLASNRVGIENGTNFVGASCALSLAEPTVLKSASRREETVVRVHIPK